ncbi:hypothetical protein GW17_00013783 [Ensete ventricosum]|nr:hypothetical protein GW17_00013783 [Ensete ventricosum]
MFFGFILHLSVRGAIFGFLYVVLGKRIWFFPNINAEETTFRELIRFWPKKDEEEPPKWFLNCRYQKKVYNIIDDVLEWSPKLALSGMMEKQHPVDNATDINYTKDESQAANAEELNDDNVMVNISSSGADDHDAGEVDRE